MLTIKYIFISCPAVTCLLNKILFSYRDLPLLFIYDSVTVWIEYDPVMPIKSYFKKSFSRTLYIINEIL